jgi:hypothetical protein
MSIVELFLLFSALALAAAPLGYVLLLRYRARRSEAVSAGIAAAIMGYFSQSGVRVTARCIPQPQDGHFLAFLDSEPHKRFRYSHIVEAVLIKHIEKTMDLHIDRVYWRFPLPEEKAGKPAATEPSAASQEDIYVTQGMLRAKAGHDYRVDEGSWDQFEQAIQQGEGAEGQKEAEAKPDGGRSD